MAEYEVVRRAVVAAEPSRVHELIANYREWPKWSPWEDIDPAMERVYSGPESGVGARYSWSGNRKAGAGSMETVADTEREVGIRLEFTKPFKSTNKLTFQLTPADGGTEVVWRMDGEQKGLMAVVGKVIKMDRLIGKDFEKGLARLQAAVRA